MVRWTRTTNVLMLFYLIVHIKLPKSSLDLLLDFLFFAC